MSNQNQAKKGDDNCCNCNMMSKGADSVHCIMRVLNLINAALLIACGVVSLLDITDIPGVLASVYIILFGVVLLLFEVHCSSFDRMIFLNFGFMFLWQGRLVFFFFVATLSIGLGVLGKIVGGCTLLNILFACYVMSCHPNYKEYMKTENAKHLNATRANEQKEGGVSIHTGVGAMANVSNGTASMEDYKNAAKFGNENKETIKKGGKIYKDNKQTIDKASAYV